MLISYALSVVIAASSLYFSIKKPTKNENVGRQTDNGITFKEPGAAAEVVYRTHITGSGDRITRLSTGELLISPTKEARHCVEPKDVSSLHRQEMVDQECKDSKDSQISYSVSKWTQYGGIGALAINTIRSVAVVPIYRNALTTRQAQASSPLVLLLLSNLTIAVQLAGLPLLIAVADFTMVYVVLAS